MDHLPFCLYFCVTKDVGSSEPKIYLPDARQRLFEAAHEDVVGKTLLCEVSLKTTSFFCGLQFHIK